MKELRVQIVAMDDEGRGRAIFHNLEGREYDVAVRGAFPGDDVRVAIERVFEARGLLVGKAEHFFHRAHAHLPRTCSHSGPCPACPLHGVESSLAMEIKRGRIERALSDLEIDCEVSDVVPHPNEYGYRQKVKLMAQIVDERLRLGVFVPYSHRFVLAEQCPYVDARINQAIGDLLDALHSVSVIMDLARIKAVILRIGKSGTAAVVVATQSLSDDTIAILTGCVARGELYSVTERIQLAETNSILSGKTERRIGPALIEPLEGGPHVDPDSFCQSDPLQATNMYDLVAKYLTADPNFKSGLYVDAYAGVGGFSRALLRLGVSDIVAIEQSENALITLNQLGVDVVLSPMKDALSKLKQQKQIAGMVVDPAKKGLMDDAINIAQLNAKRLVLVSCDPDAMARDLKVFLAHGYLVEEILPMDFFGGTPAIETIVFMRLPNTT